MSETTIRPQAPTEQPPDHGGTQPEKKSKYTLRQKLIATLSGIALAGGAAVGVNTMMNGDKAPQAIETSAPAIPTPEATPPPETTTSPAAGEYMVPLEELAGMTPEQLTAVTTISVESVSVDGQIDWDKYAEKLYDVYTLQVNAGVTRGELEGVYNTTNTPTESLGPKYDGPMISGYSAEGVYAGDSLLYGAHTNILTASYQRYLLADKVDVSGEFTVEKTTVASTDPVGGTVINIEGIYTDNLFSSGAVSVDDARSVSALGGNTDAHNILKEKYLVRTIGSNLVIVSASGE